MKRALICACAASALLGCAPDTVTEPEVELFRLRDGKTKTLGDCTASACELEGGHDSLVVKASYDGVTIEHSTSVDPPSLSILENGKVIAGPEMTSTKLDPRQFESEPYAAPIRTIDRLAVRVVAAQGYEATILGLKVSAPKITVDGGCKGTPSCMQGTGKATFGFHGWVPLDTPVKVLTWIDDVPQGVAVEPTFDNVADDGSEGSFSLDVPPTGEKWRLRVLVSDLHSADYAVTLTKAE